VDNSKLPGPDSQFQRVEICFLEATELARLIRARELSAEEMMAAYLDQVGRTNPRVNAIVTLVLERAMRDARVADERLAEALVRGEDVGPLHGLPVAHKDLAPTRGSASRSAPSSTKTSSLRRTPSSSSACDAPAP
jgi:Asp-tRNA(Asn)/Glu-tRNA(Gln) amidotransferase A subunit family amidase